MKDIVIFLIIIHTSFYIYSQTYCEGYCGTTDQSFILKKKQLGNVPTDIIPITKGWIEYAPFTDEFDSLDNTKWVIINDTHSMSPNAYFSNSIDNVDTINGKLLLKAKMLSSPYMIGGNYYNYSSGYICSIDTIRYGYIEMKCKLPQNIALAPCFWLCGIKGQDSYPFTGYEYDEIDVFELFLPDNKLDVAIENIDKTFMHNFYHNLDDTLTTRSCLTQIISFTNSFLNQDIIFAVEWLPEEIHYYVNGHITKSVKFAEKSSGWVHNDSDFTCTNFLDAIGQRFQISLSVNSLIETYPDVSQAFEIDYVRSYKLVEGFDYEYWPSSFSMSDPNMFKVHKSIRLGGNGHTATIPQNENITIWATDGIVLDKGFTVVGNTIFTARNIATTNLFNY